MSEAKHPGDGSLNSARSNIIFDDDGSIRSGWRAGFFLVVAVFVSFLLLALIPVAIPADAPPDSKPIFAITRIVMLTAVLLASFIALRAFERLPFRSVGFSLTDNWHRNFVVGCLLGVATIATAVLPGLLSGSLSFQIEQPIVWSGVAASFVVLFFAAAFEEALFRGYFLQTFARSGLAWLAIVITALFFGAIHISNPNSSAASTLNTVLAGVWFALAYLRTRDLWFAFGMHFAWNFLQGPILGIEVSGMTTFSVDSVLNETDLGPVILTGGEYGIEASFACTIALLASIAAIYLLPLKPPNADLVRMSGTDYRNTN